MTDDTNKPPPAPPGLAARGVRLWEDTVRDMELDPDEVVLLEEACRLADEVDELTAALAEGGPVAKGSRGQAVANPLIREVRAHRLALARVLRQLGATNPGEEEPAERLTPSQRGRKAAIARHHGPRGMAPVRQVWPTPKDAS